MVVAFAGEAGAQNEVSIRQRVNEHLDIRRVVLTVRIDLHDVVETMVERVLEADPHGTADTKVERELHYNRTGFGRELGRTVGGAVVHHQAANAGSRCHHLSDHHAHRRLFVKGGHHYQCPIECRGHAA